MKGKHLIFDFETMGTDVVNGFPLIDVAYVVFDADRFLSEDPYTFDELVSMAQRAKFDVANHCKTYGYKPNKETIAWWKSQGDEARKKIMPHADDITLAEFGQQFLEYVRAEKPKYWWTRGNTFDGAVIYRVFDDLGRQAEFNAVCKYNTVRDMRTYIDAKFDFKQNNGFTLPEWDDKFVKHDSAHDITADILRLQTIRRAEHDL